MHLIRRQKEEEKTLADERREENREKMLADKSNRLMANYTHEGVLSILQPVKTDKLPPYCSQVNFNVQKEQPLRSAVKVKAISKKTSFVRQSTRKTKDESETPILAIPQMTSMYDSI